MRHHSPRSGLFRRWLTTTTALAGVLPVLALTAPAARANPEGGSVVQGAATITQTNPRTVTVNQTTDKAVINWRSFSIGADETTRFNQPSSSSTTLNRVTGDQVSKILGNLSANGKVFLVNPNGIVFGAGSKIDVAALVASTADIKTENFMAGNLRFDIPGKVGAAIINQGTITAADGGLVALVSPVLRNSGIIQARLGKVALASANGVTLDLYGDNLILFQAADKITQQMVDTDGKPVTTAIDNSGQIYADGGRVLMTANTAKGVVDNAINTTGLVSARAVEQQGGEIVLKSEDGGTVQVAGRLDASGTGTGQTGGKITVQGDGVTLADGASLDASGDAGGGKVTVGGWDSSTARMASGAVIDASAKTTGNGGEATIIAADTDVAGSIRAKGGENGGNGGMIETSGHFLRLANIRIDASARRGLAGQWLLDPYDLTVDADAASSISGSLNTGTNVSLLTTANGTSGPGTAASGNGDIIIASALGWTGSGNLSLSAYRSIQINAAVTHGGSGTLSFNPGNTQESPFYWQGTVLTGRDGRVTFTGTGGLNVNNHEYTLIKNVMQLQSIGLGGYYALANDVDASETSSWNGGEGFRPIGFLDGQPNSSNNFWGTFDGFGNAISSLYINAPNNDFAALFGATSPSSTIKNVRIIDGYVSGRSYAGLLVGSNQSLLYNVYASGSVIGYDAVGVLAGGNSSGGIYQSASEGSAEGNTDVGGLVGQHFGEIVESYSSASATGTERVGGLVGYTDRGSIRRVFANGAVHGQSDTGGLIGRSNTTSVENSFWNIQTSGQGTSSGGGTGLTTAQMNNPATFTNAGWDTSVWNLTAGSAPKLKAVNASNQTPPPAPDDNPLMGLDAEGLYATILSNNWADTYSTNSYWLEVAEASGAYLSDAQKKADIMLQAWARYRNYSGQTLADKLYLDYMGEFTIGTTKITNSPDNPIWYGAYGSAASASEGQKTANVMIQAYRKFGNATARELFIALVAGRVTLDGIGAQQEIDNSPDNVVWSGIYGADRRASQAQKDADDMMVAREKYATRLPVLKAALKSGQITVNSKEWLALMDGWDTNNPHESAIQKEALAWLNEADKGDEQADKDNRNIERDRMIGIDDGKIIDGEDGDKEANGDKIGDYNDRLKGIAVDNDAVKSFKSLEAAVDSFNDLSPLVSGTEKKLVTAMNKIIIGSSISKAELSAIASEYNSIQNQIIRIYGLYGGSASPKVQTLLAIYKAKAEAIEQLADLDDTERMLALTGAWKDASISGASKTKIEKLFGILNNDIVKDGAKVIGKTLSILETEAVALTLFQRIANGENIAPAAADMVVNLSGYAPIIGTVLDGIQAVDKIASMYNGAGMGDTIKSMADDVSAASKNLAFVSNSIAEGLKTGKISESDARSLINNAADRLNNTLLDIIQRMARPDFNAFMVFTGN
ncbi:MAG: filamentous hemagglutinin N-terminal domain-containing protein, partial [Magnetospirillum sp.]